MRLSDHFSLAELTKSTTALRLGIDNSVDPLGAPTIVSNLEALALNILEPVREHFGIPFSPGSGYRCFILNRVLLSKDSSQHIRGQAADIEIPGISNFELAEWIRDNLDFDQLILEHYTLGEPTSGWVHVSYARLQKNRKEVLTVSKQGTFTELPT